MSITGNARPNPYVGPRAFRSGEKLYGRDREILALLDLLVAERIVLLHSPSGAGKTSLIQAALIPRLAQEGFRVLPVIQVSLNPPLAPQSVANGTNRYALSALLSLEEALPVERQTPLDELAGLELTDYLNRRPRGEDEPEGEVLIFDQFEEILTIDPTDQSAKEAFFAQVGAALRDRGRWALFAIREDYLARLNPYLRPIPTRLSTTFRLDLLAEAAARLVMQQPARDAGVDFTDPAARKLADDLRRTRVQQPDGATTELPGPYIEPVQLQVVCLRLWEGLPPSAHQIEEADLAVVGDVDRALASYYAERVAAAAAQTGVSERAIREWFDRHLITDQGIRGQVLQGREESQGLPNQAIRPLIDAYLVRTEKRRGATWFELAHDRLIDPVRADNRAWREANLSPLQHQATLWESQGRPDGLLLRGQLLSEAEQWAAASPDELTPVERDFLAESQEARAVAERERRQARRLRVLAIVASVISVVAVTAFLVAVYFYAESIQQSRLASARELAALAISDLDVDPERSILLALQAVLTTYSGADPPPNEVNDALQRAVQASRAQRTLTGHTNWVNDTAFDPDGTRLATASGDGTAKIWDVASGQALLTLAGHAGWVHGVAFSPDGTRLATAGGDGTAKVWDVLSGQELVTFSGHGQVVFDVAFSPDGARLATASWDNTAKIWDAASGREVLTLAGHTDRVKRLTFSPDGTRLATASDDRTAKVWDAASGRELVTLSGHTYLVSGIAFSPDGTRLATGSDDRTAKVWDALSGREVLTLSGHTQSIFGVAFNPTGTRLATASVDGTAKVWDLASGRELFALYGHANPVNSITFSPDGTQLATASDDTTAKVWNAAFGHTAAVTGVAFSPDGTRLATSSDDGTAKVWDAASGRELLTFIGHTDRVKAIAFGPDGTRLATASDDRTAKVWDAASGRELVTLAGHTRWVSVIAFSRDGTRLATGSGDQTARVWDAASGRELLTLAGHTNWVHGVAFSPDGTRLATAGGDESTRLWDTGSGQEVLRLPTNPVYSVAFSPDGTRLATADQAGTARIWDAATGRELRTFVGHRNVVFSLAFSPDGTRLATASWDKTAKVWDAGSGAEQSSFTHLAQVYSIAFSPDGTRLATTEPNGRMNVYLLAIDDLLARARARVTRSLTPDECQRYLHQTQCAPVY